jgi:septal ring factor EnvC (AmiA/AmiB activator)
MSELYYETQPSLSRNNYENKKTARPRNRWLIWSGVILLWGLLIWGSFALAQHYIGNIQQQLQDIQKANTTNVNALNQKLEVLQTQLTEHKDQAAALQEQFNSVQADLLAVKEEMSLAGDSLDTSATTKQALSERITDLSKELEGLRKLIKKLEEAARVY